MESPKKVRGDRKESKSFCQVFFSNKSGYEEKKDVSCNGKSRNFRNQS